MLPPYNSPGISSSCCLPLPSLHPYQLTQLLPLYRSLRTSCDFHIFFSFPLCCRLIFQVNIFVQPVCLAHGFSCIISSLSTEVHLPFDSIDPDLAHLTIVFASKPDFRIITHLKLLSVLAQRGLRSHGVLGKAVDGSISQALGGV